MQIVRIEPDKKYILVVPEGSQHQIEELVEALSAFKRDKVHTMLFIFGLEATLVQAEQVIGYTPFEPEPGKMLWQSRLTELEEAWQQALNLYPDLQTILPERAKDE